MEASSKSIVRHVESTPKSIVSLYLRSSIPVQFSQSESSLELLRQFLHLLPKILILRIVAQELLVGLSAFRPVFLFLIRAREVPGHRMYFSIADQNMC